MRYNKGLVRRPGTHFVNRRGKAVRLLPLPKYFEAPHDCFWCSKIVRRRGTRHATSPCERAKGQRHLVQPIHHPSSLRTRRVDKGAGSTWCVVGPRGPVGCQMGRNHSWDMSVKHRSVELRFKHLNELAQDISASKSSSPSKAAFPLILVCRIAQVSTAVVAPKADYR